MPSLRTPRSVRVLFGLVACCIGVATASAQSVWSWTRTTVPELLEARQFEEVDGEVRWTAVAPEVCAVCEGEKTTPCRACRGGEHGAAKHCAECRGRGAVRCERCVGTGETLDPFREMPCPGCWSRGVIPCLICLGVGRLDVVGGGTPSCPTCKAEGGIRCGLCRGQRRVATLRVAGGKGLDEASAEELDALDEQLIRFDDQVDAFQELVERSRPVATPAELEEPFAELLLAAGRIDRGWRGLAAQFRSLEAALERPRTGGVFSTRQVSNDDIRRLTWRQAGEAMAAWTAFHRGLIAKCHARLEAGKEATRRP